MVNDTIQSATSQLEKVKPAMAQDTVALKSAKELLQQGTKVIAEHQKHIRLADRSDYGWQLVEAYQQDELAENEKDAKKIEKAEKAVELKNRCKCKASDKEKAAVPQQSTSFQPPQFTGSLVYHHPCCLCHRHSISWHHFSGQQVQQSECLGPVFIAYRWDT